MLNNFYFGVKDIDCFYFDVDIENMLLLIEILMYYKTHNILVYINNLIL